MIAEVGNPTDKSASALVRDAFLFAAHTLVAVVILAAIVFAIYLSGASIESDQPKIIATGLALLAPMAVGFLIARIRKDRVAGYVWIAGILTFSIVSVWVLDLPTGPGLCEKCGALEKLYRTFFAIDNGSGLMAGDGLLVGAWIPLSMIGYSLGAKLGLG
jgi:hypothetical protein